MGLSKEELAEIRKFAVKSKVDPVGQAARIAHDAKKHWYEQTPEELAKVEADMAALKATQAEQKAAREAKADKRHKRHVTEAEYGAVIGTGLIAGLIRGWKKG